MTQILEKLGEECGYLIGGIINGRAPARAGNSNYFPIESDEYDSSYFQKYAKFRQYELDHMILTSLEFDHADIYNNVEEIEDEFGACLKDLSGSVVANDAYPSIRKLEAEFNSGNWTMYGEESPAGPKEIKTGKEGSSFTLYYNKEDIRFETNIVGVHNILNIAACALFALGEGFDKHKVVEALKELSLVKRRQEVRGLYRGAIVIDDFAHHPRAVTLTVDAIKAAYPEKEIVTVFEPVSATARSSLFQEEFAQSLMKSSKVILASNPLKTTVKDSKNLDCEKLAQDLIAQGIRGQMLL